MCDFARPKNYSTCVQNGFTFLFHLYFVLIYLFFVLISAIHVRCS